MRLHLRERDPHTRRWHLRLSEQVAPGGVTRAAPLVLSEASELAVTLYPDGPLPEVRLRVGDVLVAATNENDRADFLLHPSTNPERDDEDHLFCCGRLLRDWAGQTDLTVEVWHEERWQVVLVAGLFVTAGKIEQEAFEALCAEIADYSAAVLLDVHGKTFLGLESERRPGESAPLVLLVRLRQTLEQLAAALHAIAHQPAYRLQARRVREPALAEQGVSDLTLEEVCVDPTLAVAARGRLHFREQVREVASPHFDLPEHRLIAGFLHFLTLQMADLRHRLRAEVELRHERRVYRDHRGASGEKTWWEQEDLPRIEELQGLLAHLDAMERTLASLRRQPFLPPAGRLREVPPSTPLFRSHRAYASAFKVILAHFTAYRVHLDDTHLLTRARSLPTLYEWWCVLQVWRCLLGCLRQVREVHGSGSPFRRLEEDRERFLIEFSPDQTIAFEDEGGRRVLLRYVPSYHALRDSQGMRYGLLGPGRERTPDIALEIYGTGQATDTVPELIVVLDAKYSSDTHANKLDEVARKYGKIGIFATGRVLSRQVWALTPAAPQHHRSDGPEWASFCTVDNVGFWRDQFDMQSWVAGVVQAGPRMFAGRSPLETLVRLLLKRCGLTLRA